MVVHSENPKPGRNGKSNGDVWFFVWLKKVVSEAISSTTRPETEVGPRLIQAVLGGQESGVSGVDEGVKITSLPLSKWGRYDVSECATFSDFGGADNEDVSENRNNLEGNDSSEVGDACPLTFSIDDNQVSLERMISS